LNALIGKYQNLIRFNILYYYYLKIDLIHVLQKYEFNVYSIITIANLYYKVFILMKVNTKILARSFDLCGDLVMDNPCSQTKHLLRSSELEIDGYGYGVSRHIQQYFIYIVEVNFICGGNRSTRRNPPTYRKRHLTHIFKADYCFLIISSHGLVCY